VHDAIAHALAADELKPAHSDSVRVRCRGLDRDQFHASFATDLAAVRRRLAIGAGGRYFVPRIIP
jgi:hypothetical protein